MGVRTSIISPEDGKLYATIPHRILPSQWLVQRLVEPITITLTTYVYSGREPPIYDTNKLIRLAQAPKTPGTGWYRPGIKGMSGWVDKYGFPIDMRLIAVEQPHGWVDIPEKPVLIAGTFSRGGAEWRASIPMGIVRKYNIHTSQRVQIVVSRKTLTRPWRKLPIYHMGVGYTAQLIDQTWVWDIPPDIARNEMIDTDIHTYRPEADCHYHDGIVEIDFVISTPERDKMLSRDITHKAHRNMAVRNYAPVGYFDRYPFLFEIRAWWVSTPPREFWQDDNPFHRKKLIDILGITVQNLVDFYLPTGIEKARYSTLSYAEHIHKVDFNTNKYILTFQGKPVTISREHSAGAFHHEKAHSPEIVETMGEEINELRGYGDVAEDDFQHCHKYIRIVKQDWGKGAWVYNNARIEREIIDAQGIILHSKNRSPLGNIYLDKYGFVWRR